MMKYPLKLSVLALLAAPMAVARADLVLVPGITVVGGTGLGTVSTVLTISSQGSSTTEQGCVGFSAGGDVTGTFLNPVVGCSAATNGDVLHGASQTLTRTLAEAGITSASNFAILLNAAEPGGNDITLTGLVANFYNSGGALIFSAVYTGAPINFPSTEVGTGNSGFAFSLTPTQAAALQTQIGLNGGLAGVRVGLGASLSNATGGNETFFIFNAAAGTVTPEPSTIVLTASGLIGLVGFVRRRRA